MKKHFTFLIFFYIILGFSQVKDSLDNKQLFIIDSNLRYEYQKPQFLDMFKYIPKDLVGLGSYLIHKENITPIMIATSSTLASIPFDQQLTNEAANLGSSINLDNEGSYIRIKGVRMLPSNLPAAVYFIGNGGTTLLISGGLFAIGKLKNNYRMLTTSNEIIEGFISTALVTQTVKRITGRQSPVRAIEEGNPGGNWTPFPSFSAFKTNTPNYDAMPSGHLATFMTTVTIVSTNYPEVKWIKPVGYSLAGILAFQMVSSKVHWTSDYPFAILFGYVIGKNIANRRIKKINTIRIAKQEINFKTNFSYANINGYSTIGLHISF